MAEPKPKKEKKPTAAELRLAEIPEEERWKYSKFGKPLSKETLRQRMLAKQVEEDFKNPVFAEQNLRIMQKGKHEWQMIAFILPLPPPTNQWVRTWRGKARISESAKTYMQCAHDLFKSMGLWKPSVRKLKIEIRLYNLPPGSDVDGRNKQLLDSMQGTIVHNDYQFRSMLCEDAETREIITEPHVDVAIYWWKYE